MGDVINIVCQRPLLTMLTTWPTGMASQFDTFDELRAPIRVHPLTCFKAIKKASVQGCRLKLGKMNHMPSGTR